jgi:YHS domain-containing protein
MTRSRSRLCFAFSSLALLFCTAALPAQAPVHVNVDRGGLALSGYDPVAYFTEGRAVAGSAALTASHDGGTYRFATAAHRTAFLAEPARYLPQFGGFCAYGVSRNYKVKIDPEAWHIEGGRLYLNYDKAVQAKWREDIPGYIARAERNWPALRDQPRR